MSEPKNRKDIFEIKNADGETVLSFDPDALNALLDIKFPEGKEATIQIDPDEQDELWTEFLSDEI